MERICFKDVIHNGGITWGYPICGTSEILKILAGFNSLEFNELKGEMELEIYDVSALNYGTMIYPYPPHLDGKR